MFQRTSKVDKINVNIISFASLLQLGDSCIINGLSRALAVQREAEIEFGDEGNFAAYRVFSEPIPFQPIYEVFSFIPHNPMPLIKVQNIDIIGVSSSSILHVGNSKHISMESRVKHIRQLLPEGHEQDM
ncbi:putative spore germination protein GerPE [Neobacillus rhizosphaerae]|uniref:Spore germination protein GerPE n=1 Tax=Neobacillus rhizosphaerae TaxID=2880965 RepID=A0ABM9ELT1_9BACI|nr:spore germination protein GerPE [Neobacillus rhizosphaerae]CAH2713528.1 putative spore germination protein GerPE [Neobacillus rhizosphaerae]